MPESQPEALHSSMYNCGLKKENQGKWSNELGDRKARESVESLGKIIGN